MPTTSVNEIQALVDRLHAVQPVKVPVLPAAVCLAKTYEQRVDIFRNIFVIFMS